MLRVWLWSSSVAVFLFRILDGRALLSCTCRRRTLDHKMFTNPLRRFILYTDPADGAVWIHDSNESVRWTKCEIAIQLLRMIAQMMRAEPPPPLAGPPPPPPPPPCPHGGSMYNGLPWESQQSIGRDLTCLNWEVPTYSFAQSWHQRLFANTWPEPAPIGFYDAIVRTDGLQWASMATHVGRYMGMCSRCRGCGRICRIAWTASSTNHHMQVQRARILSWLHFSYQDPGTADAVPTV